MAPVLPGDLDMGVRALLAVPPGARPALARRLIDEARAGAAHTRRTGIWHPRHGSGTLLAAAAAHPCAPLPESCDARYRAALVVLLAAMDDAGVA